MAKKIGLWAFGVVFLLAVVAACGDAEPSAPTGSDSTTTTAPTDSEQKVIEACAATCQGENVPDAAPFTGDGPHPLVLLDTTGTEHDWTDELPTVWWPATVGDVQLVAILGPEEETIIEVCPYTPPPDVTRYHYQQSIRLVEAATGQTIESTVLIGTDPRECRDSEPLSLTRLDGDSVSLDQVQAWLTPFVTETR